MNNCYFVGELVSDPELFQEEDGINVVNFGLLVEDVRKDKGGKKRMQKEQFSFEAWDTAAKIIAKYKAGTSMAVECVARWCENSETVYFRVKNFKVFE
jgi:single-stranded DNA-binding protein